MEGAPLNPAEQNPASPENAHFERVVGHYENDADNHLSLEVAGYGRLEMTSHMGGENSKYKVNEDSGFAVETEHSFSFGIIDGAGGSDSGLLASITANREFRKVISEGKTLEDAFHEADKSVRYLDGDCYAAIAAAEIEVMATGGFKVSLAGIGDSKIISVREGKEIEGGSTQFQNVAHELVQMADAEEQYYVHPALSKMTAALGTKQSGGMPPQFISYDGKSGDVLIAASDGMWDNVSTYEVIEIVKKNKGTEDKIESELFALAMSRSNSKEQFQIQHDETRSVKKFVYKDDGKKRGDNITVAVMVLK